MSGKGCAACGGPVARGWSICQDCRDKADERAARRRAEKAILYEFAAVALAEPCSDGDCILGNRGGQHTNGGCRCGRLEGGAQVVWLGRVRRMLAAMAAEIREARTGGGDGKA